VIAASQCKTQEKENCHSLFQNTIPVFVVIYKICATKGISHIPTPSCAVYSYSPVQGVIDFIEEE
jgi:hypothetical protein